MLPRSVHLGYGAGSFATGTFATVPGLLLLYYLTDTLAVPAGLAAFVVFLPKAWDLLLNPYVGSRSDRTASRRPWLLAGALTLPVCFAGIFANPPLDSPVARGLYVGMLFLAAASAYALFQVPYVAMPAEMTDDPRERSTMMSYRVAFLGLAILLSGAGAPALVHAAGDGVAGYRLMAVAVAGVLFAGMITAFLGTAAAPRAARVEAEPSLRAQLAMVRTNRTFRLLVILLVLQALATGVMLAGAQYFATYVLDDPDAITVLFACLIGPLVVAMPAWVRISHRFGNRSGLLAATLLFTAGALALTAGDRLPAGLVFGCVGVCGVGYAGMQMLPLSMLADTIAADTLVSGRRRAGVFTGLWTAGETVALALGPAVFAAVLAASGFVSSDADHRVAQPDSALTGVQVGFSIVPAVILALSLPVIRRYDLTAARLDELRAVAQPG
jgi:GPH family glycoside/pentoside/hexuronide:cation symporter